MSQISTAYDAIRARLAFLFTEDLQYFELANAYELTQNSDQFLRKGWGLAAGPGTNTNRCLSGTITVGRTFTVSLTRAMDSLDLDPDTKATTVKALLEDSYSVIQDIERTFRLDGNQFNVIFEGDSGVESVNGDNFWFISTKLNFSVEIFDTL